MSKKYRLSETKIKHLAIICYREQGTNDAGVKACASHMCNYYEKWQKKNFKDVYECTFGSGWYWSKAKNEKWVQEHPNVPQSVITAVKDVIVNGNRTLPEYVDEYDCLSDVRTATNNGQWFPPEDRSQYIKDITKITNVYGSSYTFYCFPDGANGYTDAFGYINKNTATESKPDTSNSSATNNTVVDTNQRMLFWGRTGADVKLLQRKLNEKGYFGKSGKPLQIDGEFGANTEFAVMQFQQNHALQVDGIVGKHTWLALFRN